MAARFDPDSKDYSTFVQNIIHTVTTVETDMKLDYYANLTRAFLILGLESVLFYKLQKYLIQCTSDELEFIETHPYNFKSKNTVMISSLYQYGLFNQVTEGENNETFYVLSDFAKALKRNSLNYEESTKQQGWIKSCNDMKPLEISEPMTLSEIDKMAKENVRFDVMPDDPETVVVKIGQT